MFFITVVLKNFAIFTGKHLCLFLRKLQTSRPATFFKKRCFPVNVAKFLRIAFLFSGGYFCLVDVSSLENVK